NDREASGCGTETEETDNNDFSSCFFSALCGRNHAGELVSGADYDGDGQVGLDEAFCYALIHDLTIDVPVCTSDVFLRRLVAMPDPEIYNTGYKKVVDSASPAQRAALEQLSADLNLTGENRLLVAFDRFSFADPIGTADQLKKSQDALTVLNDERQSALAAIFLRWPNLRWPNSDHFS